jgi:hypothetical protein
MQESLYASRQPCRGEPVCSPGVRDFTISSVAPRQLLLLKRSNIVLFYSRFEVGYGTSCPPFSSRSLSFRPQWRYLFYRDFRDLSSLRSVEMTLFAVADTAAVPYVVVSRGPPFCAFYPNTVYCKKKWRPCGRHYLLWIYLINYLTSTFLVSITPLL